MKLPLILKTSFITVLLLCLVHSYILASEESVFEAENIIVAMGSVTSTIKEVVDYMNAKGEKVGVVIVHLYRPFSPKYFFKESALTGI